jgi:hypothetical protein
MAVVIDDFEVLPEESNAQQPAGSAAGANSGPSAPTVHDIERVVERQADRYERVWAH